MNFLVFDNDDFERAKKITRALTCQGVTAVFLHNESYYDNNGKSVSPLIDLAVVFYHQRNVEALSAAKVGAQANISYSAGSGAEIKRVISAGEGFTDNEAFHIVREVTKSLDCTLKNRILAYWELDPECLALCLFCEAWIITQGVAEVTINGLKIHAACQFNDWFEPLRITSLGEKENKSPDLLVIDGEIFTHVEKLRGAISDGKLSWANHREDVKQLSNKLKERCGDLK